jgi:hypothetical protein
MILSTATDKSQAWAPIAKAFDSAADAFCSQRAQDTNDDAAVGKPWDQASAELHSAGLAVAHFISGEPRIVQEKDVMASSLVHLAQDFFEPWLEGLGNLITASTAKLPDGFPPPGSNDSLPVPQITPSWPPAINFWETVKECDAAIGPAALAVLEARPMSEEELCDKTLVAAFTGALAFSVRTIALGPVPDRTALQARRWMHSLVQSTNLNCLAAILDPRSFDELMDAVRRSFSDPDPTPAELVRMMLGLADIKWRRAIWNDAKRLGLVVGWKRRGNY